MRPRPGDDGDVLVPRPGGVSAMLLRTVTPPGPRNLVGWVPPGGLVERGERPERVLSVVPDRSTKEMIKPCPLDLRAVSLAVRRPRRLRAAMRE